MSECVVRMEMPESCEKCPVCDYEEGNCLLADDRNTLPHNGERREWCPIICSLPEGHGRLVDAETVLWEVPDSEGRVPPMPICIEDIIQPYDVDTIVPAEAERSET